MVPGVKPNDKINELRKTIKFLTNIAGTLGPSPTIYSQISHYRRILADEYHTLHDKVWGEIIDKIQDSPDIRTFFTSIKRFAGYSKKNTTNVIDSNGHPIITPAEKAQAFRQVWSEVFRNDQEDHLFCSDNLARVEDHVARNEALLAPLQTSNIQGLDDQFPPITIDEVETLIKQLKHKAPGPSGITAPAMKALPP